MMREFVVVLLLLPGGPKAVGEYLEGHPQSARRIQVGMHSDVRQWDEVG